jgi:hypothetical protein
LLVGFVGFVGVVGGLCLVFQLRDYRGLALANAADHQRSLRNYWPIAAQSRLDAPLFVVGDSQPVEDADRRADRLHDLETDARA